MLQVEGAKEAKVIDAWDGSAWKQIQAKSETIMKQPKTSLDPKMRLATAP